LLINFIIVLELSGIFSTGGLIGNTINKTKVVPNKIAGKGFTFKHPGVLVVTHSLFFIVLEYVVV